MGNPESCDKKWTIDTPMPPYPDLNGLDEDTALRVLQAHLDECFAPFVQVWEDSERDREQNPLLDTFNDVYTVEG